MLAARAGCAASGPAASPAPPGRSRRSRCRHCDMNACRPAPSASSSGGQSTSRPPKPSARTRSAVNTSKEKPASCRCARPGPRSSSLPPGRGDGRELAVLDQYRLRLAGGAGGVDGVGQVLPPGCVARRRWRVRRPRRSASASSRSTAGAGGQRRAEGGQGGAVGEQQGGPAVGQQVAEPGGGVVRVQRQVAGAGLEHGEHRDDQLRGAGQADRDQGVRARRRGRAGGGPAGWRGRRVRRSSAGRRGCDRSRPIPPRWQPAGRRPGRRTAGER